MSLKDPGCPNCPRSTPAEEDQKTRIKALARNTNLILKVILTECQCVFKSPNVDVDCARNRAVLFNFRRASHVQNHHRRVRGPLGVHHPLNLLINQQHVEALEHQSMWTPIKFTKSR